MKKVVIILNCNTNRQSAKKNIRFEHELLYAIEKVKPNNQPFSQWVKEACWDKIRCESDANTSMCAQEDNRDYLSVRTVRSGTDLTPSIIVTPELLNLVVAFHQQGLYYQQIADKLNDLKIPSVEGKCWSRIAIKKLIESCA